MTVKGASGRARLPSWLSPFRVAVVGTLVVLLLLIMPIRILGPGDHEKKSCGNGLSLNLERWRNTPDGDYWDRAHRSCTSQRVDRIAWSVGVLSVTVLVVTVLATRARRPE